MKKPNIRYPYLGERPELQGRLYTCAEFAAAEEISLNGAHYRLKRGGYKGFPDPTPKDWNKGMRTKQSPGVPFELYHEITREEMDRHNQLTRRAWV